MVSMENKKVVCFGEVLWDILPTGKKPGGAPMNVAYHLNRLGIQSTIISSIGMDDDGDELKVFLSNIGMPTEFIQTDEQYPTSKVLARIGADDEVTYDIVAPVAWDFIRYEHGFARLIEDADVLVYGSLVARNATSRDTLLQLLDRARYRLMLTCVHPTMHRIRSTSCCTGQMPSS
jgi:fructokinase